MRCATIREGLLAAHMANIIHVTSLSSDSFKLLRAPEIDQFRVPTGVQNNVACLDIAMHEPMSVHVRDSRDHFGRVKLGSWHLVNGLWSRYSMNVTGSDFVEVRASTPPKPIQKLNSNDPNILFETFRMCLLFT